MKIRKNPEEKEQIMSDIQPMEYDELYDYADQCAQDRRYDEALEIYNRLHRDRPDNDSLLLSIAWVYRDRGDVEQAFGYLEELLEKELARNIFTGFAFDELVKMYREMEEYEKLVMLCELAVAKYPHDPALLRTLGDSCLRSGRWDRALEVFSTLTDMDSKMSVYFMNRGLAAVGAGKYNDAEADCVTAIQLEPEDAAMIYDRFATAFEEADQAERALALRKKAVESSGNNPHFYCGLGDLYLSQGRIEEARNAYEEACRIIPASRGSLCNRLANMMIKTGFIAEAIEEFENALEADPANPFYYLSLIGCCEAIGDQEGVRKFRELGRLRGALPAEKD